MTRPTSPASSTPTRRSSRWSVWAATTDPLDAARPETSPLAHAREDAAPFLPLHGDRDSVVQVQSAREFAASLRAMSHASVELVELPGAQHAFDHFQTLRSAPVAAAIETFTAVESPALTGGYSNVAG